MSPGLPDFVRLRLFGIEQVLFSVEPQVHVDRKSGVVFREPSSLPSYELDNAPTRYRSFLLI
jgi:hypothetical protein